MRRPAPALLAAVCLTACGTSTIDTPKTERFIRGVVVEQVGARVATVACPDDVDTQEGERFTCAVTGTDGSRGDVLVTQRDGSGKVDVDAPFLHVREAEAAMTDQLAERLDAGVSVACPEIVVAGKGERFRCTATSAGRTRSVDARLTGADGRFTYRLR